jgi:integrase
MRGTVRKRGNTWSIIYDERPDPATGERRRRERGGFADRDTAETELAEAIAAVKSGGYVDPSKVTVARFLTDWIERKAEDDLKPTTATSYRSKIEHHLIPRLGSLRVQELDVARIEDALRDVHREGGRKGAPLSLRTVNYCRVVLASALDDAVRRGMLQGNPARLARIPTRQREGWKPRSAPRKPWSVEELCAFLETAADDRLAALWMLYVTNGMRRGEALGLRWSDVDLEAATISVARVRTTAEDADGHRVVYDDDDPKTAASRRTVTLDKPTVAALRSHRLAQLEERVRASSIWEDGDRVFCREDGSGLDPDAISGRWRELCTEGEVRYIRPHDARHSCATLMLAGGVPVEVISERLGHARISVTMDMYVHPDDASQRAAADTFGAIIARGSGA